MALRDPSPCANPHSVQLGSGRKVPPTELVVSPMVVATPIPVDTAGLDTVGLSRRTLLACAAVLGGRRLV